MEKQWLIENRTKRAKSGGSERNCPGERISGSDRLPVVRRFAHEGPQTLEFQSRRGAREKLCKKWLAEGEELYSNILLRNCAGFRPLSRGVV